MSQDGLITWARFMGERGEHMLAVGRLDGMGVRATTDPFEHVPIEGERKARTQIHKWILE